MALITRLQFDNNIDLPISLPATEIGAGDWLTIAAVKISATTTSLNFRCLNLNLLKVTTTGGDPVKIDASRGWVYTSLAHSVDGIETGHYVDASALGLTAHTLSSEFDGNTVGVYTITIKNNLSNASIWASVTGQFRLTAAV